MKARLLSCALLATVFSFNKLEAQCTVSPPAITNIQQSGCTFHFDMNFNLAGNGGNKITAVYIYNTADYNALPANFYGQNSNHVPSSSELNTANALATIKINLDSALTVYNYQKVGNSFQSPNSMEPGLTYTIDPSGQVTVKNISVSFASCNTPITLKADVLSSQSPDLGSVGCIAKGLSFSPNEPIERVLSKGCGTSRVVTTTFITTQPTSISFHVFKDVAPFGQFTAADTAAANSVSPMYNTTTAFNSTTNDYRSVGDYAYTVTNGEQFNVWVVAYATGVPNVSFALASNTCAPLAATFRSFNAIRNSQSIAITWETLMEDNSRGFNVQRLSGSGDWQSIAFVATKAINGSSNTPLSYTYSDPNTTKGVSQYRIQQVSLDGKLSYSEVRSIRSQDMAGKVVVYPNPSSDGKVTVAFENAGEKDILVSDVTGRMVKRFSSIKNNSLVIDNLNEGFYTIQILEKATATVSIEKVVIKKQ